jgi:hypothetical protein
LSITLRRSSQLLSDTGVSREPTAFVNEPEDTPVPPSSGAKSGRGSLYTDPALVLFLKLNVVRVANSDDVYHQQNRRLGAVAEVGENLTKAPTRILTVNTDSLFTRRLEIRDQSGECVLTVTRPRKLFKNVLRVSGPSGELLGNAVQEELWGKKRFSFVVSGQRVGGMDGDSMIVPRAWSIRDEAGTEVATVQKRFLLTRPKPLSEPLASMALACGLTIDLILAGKQLPPFLTLMTGTPG